MRPSQVSVLTPILFVLLVTLTLSPTHLQAAADQDCGTSSTKGTIEPLTLRVALYPFIPDNLTFFHNLESIFECENPGVDLRLVSTPNATYEYYTDDEADKKGFQFVDADVYEIDTILLSDFIALGKIAPIDLPFDDFAPEGIQAVTRQDEVYGVPHWLCGNFMFYRKDDVEIRNAATWKEIIEILKLRDKALLVDLKGRSTLGEWYLTALSEIVGLAEAQKQVAEGMPINSDAMNYLRDIVAGCPNGYCRSDKMHDSTGFYARAFIRGEAAVYIGYSETIHYGLREEADNCLTTSGCLGEDDIGVRSLPPFDPMKKPVGVGWVDALAIGAELTGRKKDLALRFIRLAVSDSVYLSIVEPSWPYSSRYLLPARQGVAVNKAPLYEQFFAAHLGRQTGTLPNLNRMLRTIAGAVNCDLPIDRDDIASKTSCSK
ncbi:extracellular solute-binding protein [Rhizobium leguminosarum]|uniref:extracellular solute-binding protein n=1 Tax=Rhizobium leguminosarum TaxID=384 RepID=UPI000FEC21EB|nr:extracellular solute-binding protein [Rhizobium leguminosarum]RWX22852.1 extracellular solute-binding protein [Rhizobium leguminosarum]